MIWVTRLDGSEVVLNADLIETMEPTPDTVITLVDGAKYVVREPVTEVVAKIQHFRAAIVSMADEPVAPGGTIHHLSPVPERAAPGGGTPPTDPEAVASAVALRPADPETHEDLD